MDTRDELLSLAAELRRLQTMAAEAEKWSRPVVEVCQMPEWVRQRMTITCAVMADIERALTVLGPKLLELLEHECTRDLDFDAFARLSDPRTDDHWRLEYWPTMRKANAAGVAHLVDLERSTTGTVSPELAQLAEGA